jgi:hypothetical protein
MTTLPLNSHAPSSTRMAGRSAIASGVVGIVAFGCLVAYLATQVSEFGRTGVMPAAGRILISMNYVGVAVQALCLIPAVIALDRMGGSRSPGLSKWAMRMCVSALVIVIVVRLLIFVSPAVSDILFIAPMGFVGVWLLVINGFLKGLLPGWLRIVGLIAGAGLTVVGLNFFFNGGMAVFTHGPWAYADDIPFHKGLALGGLPGFILFPIWAIFAGIRLARSERT